MAKAAIVAQNNLALSSVIGIKSGGAMIGVRGVENSEIIPVEIVKI
jgi:hypothetical protein